MSDRQLIILKNPPTLQEMCEVLYKMPKGYSANSPTVELKEIEYIIQANKLPKSTLANRARHHLS